jgi:hypothetical protein
MTQIMLRKLISARHKCSVHQASGLVQTAFSETFDSRFVLLSELSTKIGGRGNAGLMESEENIKPFPTLPTVLGNHQRTVITTFPPHDDGYGLILTFLSGTQ